MRKTPFIVNGLYHVYNRGVDKRPVFTRFGHYLRFQNTVHSILNTGSATQRLAYNQGLALKSKVSILAYCLMPNHYHFLIKETQDGGISEFMQKLNTSYTMYFNLNNHRSGHLFEYAFKAKMIESDEVLLHVSRYIHLNPVVKHLVEKPHDWRWSSYKEYFDIEAKHICDTEQILRYFSTTNTYTAFVEDAIAYKTLIQDIELEKDEDSLFL